MQKIKLKQKTSSLAKKYELDYQIANFGERSYPLFYGNDIIQYLGTLLHEYGCGEKILIVSHPKIKRLFESRINKAMKNYSVQWTLFPQGEKHKNLTTMNSLYTACAKANLDKNSVIIALGGGVVQDMANYLAATYLRGIPFVQIPTTLLSQSDIGIGGCAVNHPAGKSLIGQFYQPHLALLDSSIFKTLPQNEISSGIAEIINKVLCLGGYDTKKFEQDLAKMLARDQKTLQSYVRRANTIKLSIIEKDETGRKGSRLLLDWGHTITYALEQHLAYSVSHGWALGIGMHGAATLSSQLGYLSEDQVTHLKKIIKKASLPTKLPANVNILKLIGNMHLEQRTKKGEKKFILLQDFGKAFVSHPIGFDHILACLNKINS